MSATNVGATRRRRAAWLLAPAAVTCAALALGVTSGSGATPDTAYDATAVDSRSSQSLARFPERVIDAGDLTGDGVRDVFASNYVLDVGGTTDAGGVTLVSGGDRSVRYELTSPEIQASAQFGFYISVPGDVDGDGKDDVAVGAPYQDVYTGSDPPCGAAEPNGCNENQGKAYVFSGAGGRFLYDLENPNPQADEGVFATFGARIGAAGDVTGDSVPDIIVGSPANDVPAGCGAVTPVAAGCRQNEGEAFIFNGASGALVRTLRVPAVDRQDATCSTLSPMRQNNRCGNLSAAQSPGDVDRDGVADQLVAAYSLRRPSLANPQFFGRLYLFSGKTGEVLTRLDQPEPDNNAFFGLQDLAPDTPGDVNGDGTPDLYASGFLQDGAGGESGAGRGWIFDGKKSLESGTGVVLRELKDPSPRASEAFGFTASRTDYNKDGTPDTYVSGLQGMNTETFIYDGRDGSLMKTLALPEPEVQANQQGNTGSGLGYSSRAPGDLNGDGEPDYVAAAPFQDVNGVQDQGKLYFFLSNVPAPAPDPTPTTPDDGVGPRVRPNLFRPVARVSQSGSRIVVRVQGRMVGNRGRACGGRIKIGTRAGRRRVATRTARMGRNCRYSARYTIPARRLPQRLRPRNRTLVLSILVRYQGNSLLTSDLSPPRRAKVRR